MSIHIWFGRVSARGDPVLALWNTVIVDLQSATPPLADDYLSSLCCSLLSQGPRCQIVISTLLIYIQVAL